LFDISVLLANLPETSPFFVSQMTFVSTFFQMFIELHEFSPSGGFVSLSGGFASLLFDQAVPQNSQHHLADRNAICILHRSDCAWLCCLLSKLKTSLIAASAAASTGPRTGASSSCSAGQISLPPRPAGCPAGAHTKQRHLSIQM
jgi:hypothetical protein